MNEKLLITCYQVKLMEKEAQIPSKQLNIQVLTTFSPQISHFNEKKTKKK